MFQGDEEYTQLLELTNVALDRDFREKSVKSLLRRIRDTDGKRNSSNFMFALQRKSPETECIMIATPKDGRIQIEKLKYAVEVLSYKLWCDPDLMSRVDLKRNSKCQFHATDTKYICINPYHLQKTTKTEKECHKRARPSSPATRPNVNLTDVRLNENYQLNFDQNYFDDDHIDDLKSPTTSNDSDFYEYSEWILTFYTLFYFRTLVNILKYSSSHNGSSPTHQVQPNQATIYQFEHEESENWCSLKYYEYNQLVGSFDIRADHAKIQIDGFSSTNQPQRISLGAISNPFRSVKVRTCQKNIRQGQLEPYLSGVDNFYCLRVTLTYENGMVKMTNLSESAVFVQSRSMNENYQADPFAIIKLCQHNEAIIFNNLDFAQRLKYSVDRGFDEVYSLIDLCSVRISFVKGWGENYARKYVTDTLCWVELTINTPMDWLDKVSRNMRESHYKCTSNS